LTRMTAATDLEDQRRVFDELRHCYSPEDAEAALQEFLAQRTPPPS
jgi:hypothetical protein